MADTVKRLCSTQIPAASNCFAANSDYYAYDTTPGAAFNRHSAVIELDSTHLIVAYIETSSYKLYVKLGTLTNDSIVYGDAFEVVASTGTNRGLNIIKLDSSRVVLLYKASSTGYANAIIVKNTAGTLSKGSSYAFKSSDVTSMSLVGCKIDTDKVVVGYTASTTSSMKVLTISDTTITGEGAESNISGTRYMHHIEQMDTNAWHIVYGAADQTNIGAIYDMYCTNSTTTITQGAENATVLTSNYGCVSRKVTTSTAIIFTAIQADTRCVVNSINTGTRAITDGTVKSLVSHINQLYCKSIIAFSSTYFAIVGTHATSTPYATTLQLVSVSGTTITDYQVVKIPNPTTTYYGAPGKCAVMSSGLAFILSSDAYRNNNLKGISLSGTTLSINNGSGTTCITGVTGGTTEISSIKITNNGGSTVNVSIYTGGTGTSDADIEQIESVAAYSTTKLLQPNSPIILASTETLRITQDGGQPITVKAYGVEVI